MIEKLYSLRVKRKVIRVLNKIVIFINEMNFLLNYNNTCLIVEKVYGVCVQFQTECLQKEYVIAHDILVGEVKLVHHYGVHMVITQQVIY